MSKLVSFTYIRKTVIKFSYLVLSWLILSSLLACSSKQTLVDPSEPGTEQPNSSGDITEVGQPQGVAVSKTIGPEGGTLATADGRVQLTIPAGAVDKATTISIQPITNHTPNGVGQSYRFLPDGIQFSKPAILTFTYTDAEIKNSVPAALGIAYQRANKIWFAVPGKQIDTDKHQVSVPMLHFSDWSLFEEFSLVTKLSGRDTNIINYGESITLEVVHIASLTGTGEEPLSIKTTGGQANDGLKWSLSGEGKLTPAQGSATYTAPMFQPKQNPVTISVEITFKNNPAKLILVRELYVGSGYIKINFLGQERTYSVSAFLDDRDPDNSVIVGATSAEAFSIHFSYAKQGSVLIFSDERKGNKCEVDFGNGVNDYDSGHSFCDGEYMNANGQVVFEKYERGKFAKGKISGNLIKSDEICTKDGPTITGEFFVRSPFN